MFIRICAGPFTSAGGAFTATGPFKTICDVQMLDFNLNPNASYTHELPAIYDNCLVYVYGKTGAGSKINGHEVGPGSVVRLGAGE